MPRQQCKRSPYPSRADASIATLADVPIPTSSLYNAATHFFNTAGPVNPEDHYYLPPLARLHLDELLMLIQQKKYFILHAPRQTGKTSALLALMEHPNASSE